MKRVISGGLILSILALFAPAAFAQQCQAGRVSLQMLGTRGPALWDARASTSYLLWLDGKARLVVDAGPGSVRNFGQSGANYEDLRVFLFTHFHVDHSSGFPAYVKGGFFTDRTEDLQLFGPGGNEYLPSAEQFVQRLFGQRSGVYPYLNLFVDPAAVSSYKIRAHSIESSHENPDERKIYADNQISVTTAAVHHGVLPALAYRVELAGCVIGFTGDMSGRYETMPGLARDSDILVAHNAIAEDETGVGRLLHMKPGYIGKLAAQARVKQLLLTHLMKRSIDRKKETLRMIRENYAGPVSFPDDLDIIEP